MKRETIQRWAFSHERLSFEATARLGHVVFEVTDCGYDESSRLGLGEAGPPERLRRLASALREAAEAIDVACAYAETGK